MLIPFLLPAFFASLVAILVTVAIERLGGQRGGLLGTLPTTIVPAAIAFSLIAPTETMREALHIVPAGMLINAIFLYTWRVFPRRLPAWPLLPRLSLMVFLSLGVWSLLALGTVVGTRLLLELRVASLVLGLVALATAIVTGLAVCWQERPAPAGTRRVGALTLLARGVFAGTAVGLAVWGAEALGPLLAGMLAIFPAIFVTTMTSLWWSQGEAVPAGAIGPMMLGSTSVSAFALLAAQLIPPLGPWVGALIAWLLSGLLITLPAWWILHRRPWARRVPSPAGAGPPKPR